VGQSLPQQVGEQERRQVVEGEGALQPIGGDVAGVPVPPDIVDQHIDPGAALEDLGGQPPHLHLGGEVGHEHVGLAAAAGVQLTSRGLGGLPVAATDRQVRAHPDQAQGGRPADAAAGPGDQHRPTGHRSAVELFHGRAPVI
jgi:hypothetical protein